MGRIVSNRRMWSRLYIATFSLTDEPASGVECSGAERCGASGRLSEWFLPPMRRFERFGPIVLSGNSMRPQHLYIHYVAQRPQGCRIGLMPERNIVILLKINQTRPCATFCYPGNLWQGPKVQLSSEWKMWPPLFNPPPLQPKRNMIEAWNLACLVLRGVVFGSLRRFLKCYPWALIWGWGRGANVVIKNHEFF